MTTGNYDESSAPTEDPQFGATYWDARSADHVFRRGSGEDAETRDMLQGFLDAIWKEWDEGNDKEDIAAGWRLRIRMINKGQLVIRSGAAVLTYSLIAKLHDVHKGEWIAIKLVQGNKPKISFPLVKVWREGKRTWDTVQGAKLDPNGDRLEEAMELVCGHDAYIEAPKKADANDSAAMASEEAKAKGWPAIEVGGETDALYLDLILQEVYEDKESFGSLKEIPEVAWAQFRAWMQEQKSMPNSVERWIKRMKAKGKEAASIRAQAPEKPAPAATAAVNDDYDPFADE